MMNLRKVMNAVKSFSIDYRKMNDKKIQITNKFWNKHKKAGIIISILAIILGVTLQIISVVIAKKNTKVIEAKNNNDNDNLPELEN